MTINEFTIQMKDKESLGWENMFVFVKFLVYRRDPLLNIIVCKYYLYVMSKLSLKEYDKLGKKSPNKVLAYLEKKNKWIKNSISLTNLDDLENQDIYN